MHHNANLEGRERHHGRPKETTPRDKVKALFFNYPKYYPIQISSSLFPNTWVEQFHILLWMEMQGPFGYEVEL